MGINAQGRPGKAVPAFGWGTERKQAFTVDAILGLHHRIARSFRSGGMLALPGKIDCCCWTQKLVWAPGAQKPSRAPEPALPPGAENYAASVAGLRPG